ncbi:MAG: ABC transporter ATP-binding protein, partial [Candidatus Bathyarchaeota archaeon]
GEILFKGEDLLKKSKEDMRILRSKELATIFQDPLTYLNPVLKIETQLLEVFLLNKELMRRAVIAKKTNSYDPTFSNLLTLNTEQTDNLSNQKVSRSEIKKMAKHLSIDLLNLVMLPDPERILGQYPFELSGGMRQRAMIAMALARRPAILVADEITTAVDVTIQAQILYLMKQLRDKIDASTIMITHDLSVAAEVADRIAVMYGGNVVEVACTVNIFKKPLHPYTTMLMKAIPNVKRSVDKLKSIPGSVPEMINPPSGCRFHPRCPFAIEDCTKERPKLIEIVDGHKVACYVRGIKE